MWLVDFPCCKALGFRLLGKCLDFEGVQLVDLELLRDCDCTWMPVSWGVFDIFGMLGLGESLVVQCKDFRIPGFLVW